MTVLSRTVQVGLAPPTFVLVDIDLAAPRSADPFRFRWTDIDDPVPATIEQVALRQALVLLANEANAAAGGADQGPSA